MMPKISATEYRHSVGFKDYNILPSLEFHMTSVVRINGSLSCAFTKIGTFTNQQLNMLSFLVSSVCVGGGAVRFASKPRYVFSIEYIQSKDFISLGFFKILNSFKFQRVWLAPFLEHYVSQEFY